MFNLTFPVLPNPDGTFSPCPDLLTEDEAIRFLRLDVEGGGNPRKTLEYYRYKKLLRAIKVGRYLRYPRSELVRFMEKKAQLDEE